MRYLGIGMLALAALLLAGGLVGLYPLLGNIVFGQPALRAIASLAVAGCLVAAIGYWDD